jgi:hypothetical protein
MRRKLLLFGVQFLPIFAVCVWLYPRVLPVYQRLVVATVNVGLERLEPPMRMERTDDGGWQTYERAPDGTETKYWYRPGLYLNLMFLGIALLPALVLATPIPPLARLKLAGLGMVLLLLCYLPASFGLVLAVRCLARDPAAAPCLWGRTVANVWGQLISVVLWGLLTWHVWLPASRRTNP